MTKIRTKPFFLLAGGAHIDRRARSSGPFRPAASNPGVMREAIGGAVLNAGLVLRAFGAPATFLGGRGGDQDGTEVAECLARAGICDLAITWLDRRTPSYTAVLDERGELVAGIADMQLYDLLVPRLFRRRRIRPELLQADALVLDANLPEPTLGHLVEAFAGRPTACIGVSPAKAVRLSPILSRVSVAFLSRAEAAAVADASVGTDVASLARLLSEKGARRAVVTDGPREIAILDDGAVYLQAPPPASPKDVTGAGDTLAGAAFLGFCRGEPILEAVGTGLAAASLRISSETFPDAGFAEDVRRIAGAIPPPRPCK